MLRLLELSFIFYAHARILAQQAGWDLDVVGNVSWPDYFPAAGLRMTAHPEAPRQDCAKIGWSGLGDIGYSDGAPKALCELVKPNEHRCIDARAL